MNNTQKVAVPYSTSNHIYDVFTLLDVDTGWHNSPDVNMLRLHIVVQHVCTKVKRPPHNVATV